MKAEKISLEEAKEDKLFYFVANVVPFRRDDGRCLILKRDMRETVHPGKWAVPGGKLEWQNLDIAHPTRMNGDVFDFENAVEDLLAREAQEEANIEVGRDIRYINSVAFIRPDGIPVVLVKFAAEYLGGDVIPEQGGFTEFAWVDEEEARTYDCIDGVHGEIAQAIRLFS